MTEYLKTEQRRRKTASGPGAACRLLVKDFESVYEAPLNPEVAWLGEQLSAQSVVVGGSVMAMISTTKFEDIDVFNFNFDGFCHACKLLKSNGYSDDKSKWSFKDAQTSPETVPFVTFYADGKKPVQVIKLVWYKDVDHIFSAFDLVCCQFALYQNSVHWTLDAMKDAQRRIITVNRALRIDGLLKRIEKYKGKGFKTWEEYFGEKRDAGVGY